MLPPTLDEINVYGSPDEEVAVERFLGKDVDQAAELFRENFFRYTEDLMWMGPVAFRYYIRSVIQVVCTGTYHGGVLGLEGALEHRLEYEPDELVPVCIPLAALCDYIVTHWNELGSSRYGEEIRDQYVALRDRFREMNEA